MEICNSFAVAGQIDDVELALPLMPDSDDSVEIPITEIDDSPNPPTTKDLLNRTESEMRLGRRRIDRGLLRSGNWWGRPRFLEKRAGRSLLGAWHYAPGAMRYGGKHDRSSDIVLTYYALLLEAIQGVLPAKFTLIVTYSGRARRDPVEPHVLETLTVMEQLETTLGLELDPGPRLKSKCSECRWHNACHKRALEIKHLTLLPKIGGHLLPRFKELGLINLEDLAGASPGLLQSIRGFDNEATAKLTIERARAYCTGKPTVVGHHRLPSRKRVEAFLDFEADEMTVFLSGLLVREGQRLRYFPYLATSDRRFRKANRDFVRHLAQLPDDAPIFHYGWYDRNKLALLPGGTRFVERLIDILPIVKKHAALPSKSLRLKEVASVLGLRVADAGANGRAAQAGGTSGRGLIKNRFEGDC